MGSPHKHAGVIVAWASGKQIQALRTEGPYKGQWMDLHDTPQWLSHVEYRVKPEGQKILHFYKALHVGSTFWPGDYHGWELSYKHAYERSDTIKNGPLLGIVEITVDETDKRLLSARVCCHLTEF